MTLSALEALCNAVIGLLVSWAVTFYALPLIWGLAPSGQGAAGIAILYFVISSARSFVIREIFRRLT